MHANEFCYWIQGLFELGEPTSITPKQVDVIRNHLNLVKKVDKGLSGFCAWLEVMLDILKEKGDICDSATQAAIHKKLAETFEHVIDPSYGENQEALSAIHTPHRPPHSGRPPGMRC